ncbi:TetR family transcriptional regulator [Nocardioides flavescens]|uniref:TetR family transcriptional regulator n=1 Tax=Nocardioides flavescens TaxID=2691959 RepID=UPI001927537C
MSDATEPPAEGGPPVDGRAARWSGQQERRRAEFVEAALRAIERHGEEVSTEQIAAEAGVARTRLYRHFAGAQELNQAIAARVEQLILDGLTPVWDPTASPAVIIRTAVSTHLHWLTEHHALYRYLVRHSVTTASGDTVVNDVKRLIADLLVRLLDEYVALLGLDARIIQPLSFGLVGFVDAAAERWVVDPRGVEVEEMVDLLAEWIWSVLAGVLRAEGLDVDPETPLVSP